MHFHDWKQKKEEKNSDTEHLQMRGVFVLMLYLVYFKR